MKDQIVKIITDYLNKMEVPEEKWDGTVGFFPAGWPLPTCTIADEIAEKITAAIAPRLESMIAWEDAPSWAKWRTVDKDGQETFWEKQPHAHLLSKYWCDDSGGNRKYCEVDGWQHKIEQRPR